MTRMNGPSPVRTTLFPAFCYFLVFSLLAASGTVSAEEEPPFGLAERTPWTTSRLVGSPEPPLPYTVERAFTKLELKTPIYVIEEPGTDHLWAILYTEGDKPCRVVRFRNAADAEVLEICFEIPNQILYSICPDPAYATNRWVYVFTNGPTSETERKDRIARFTVTSDNNFDPASEHVILEWRSAGHDGGDMAFDAAGLLYITTGDGTGDSDTWDSGQSLDDLLGAVLRIDVRDSTPEQPYRIPPDNPFVDHQGARGEIWAYGLRNPWRMSIDRPSGQVWVGNNGQDLWETAHLVRRGENYGWSVYEGNHPFYLQRKRGPTPLVPPTIEHSHAEFRSLTGGVVYRGPKFPELDGAYLYGDYSSGRIWGMKHDGDRVLWHRELADTSLMISGFRVDRHGELLIADHGGGIYRLVPAPADNSAASFPRRLSETGLFADSAAHQPDPAVLPYSVNVPGWMDGATAERFMAVPGDAKVTYQPSQSWQFPDGTALVQTLSLERQAGDPASRFRLETRVLLKWQAEWAAYTYRWNDEQTDAELVAKEGADAELTLTDADGTERKQSWRFASRVECMTCHSRAANFVLGLTEAQLNREHDYPAAPDNQLRTLEHIGLFAAALPAPADGRKKLADLYDTSGSVDLEARVRSYLHVNCAVCHVAAGGGNARMELGIATDRAKMELIEARPQHDTFGIANAMLVAPGDPARSVLLHRLSHRSRGQMPPLVSRRVDEQAVALVQSWIESLPPKPIVQKWQLSDLLPELEQLAGGRNAEQGKTTFREIGCAQCHRVGEEGGSVGPNLSDIARRLSAREILEAIVEPSAKVADEYATWLVQTDDGLTSTGIIEREEQGRLVLRQASTTDPPVEIDTNTIVARRKSDTSNMPAGTLDVLHKQQILDLLAYLLNPAPSAGK